MSLLSLAVAFIVVFVGIGMIRTYARLYEDGDRVGAGFVAVGTLQLIAVTFFWLLGVDPNV